VKQGVRLRLAFRVSQIDGSSCTPLSGAIIDVWHCDALGVYSDVTDRVSVPSGKSSCAAICDTNANGLAEFVTIYPVGIQAERFTSTLRFAPLLHQQDYEFTCSFTSMMPSRIKSTRSLPMRKSNAP